MRRPGNNKAYQAFTEASNEGGLVRPSTRSTTKRDAPFSLRLSQDERARLKAAAGNLPLGAYIKARLFEGLPLVPRQRAPHTVDRQVMSLVLSKLGQTRLSANMNQIAHAANRGTLPLDTELIEDLNAACTDIRAMRIELLKALGQRPKVS